MPAILTVTANPHNHRTIHQHIHISKNNTSATLTPTNNHHQLLATHLARIQHLRTLLNGATPRKAHFLWAATNKNDYTSLKAPWPTAVAKQGPLSHHGHHACCCQPSHHSSLHHCQAHHHGRSCMNQLTMCSWLWSCPTPSCQQKSSILWTHWIHC